MNLDQLKTTSDINEIIKKMDEYGIAIISNFASDETIQTLRKEYDICMTKDAPELMDKEYSAGKLTVINNNQETASILPDTMRFFNSDFMNKVSTAYYKNKKVLLNHEIYVCKDVKESEHVSQGLHYDRIPTLKFFLYLNDVTARNGAFHCVPGSHKATRKSEKFNRDHQIFPEWSETRADSEENLRKELPIEGKAGTLIIVHTDVVHRAGKLSEGERHLMRGHTRAFDEIPANWPKKSKSLPNKAILTIQKKIHELLNF